MLDFSDYFLYVALIACAVYLFVRQRIDLFLVAFGGTLIYNWQIIYGEIWVPPYEFSVSDPAKYICSIVFYSILIAAAFKRCYFRKSYFSGGHEVGCWQVESITIANSNYDKVVAYCLCTKLPSGFSGCFASRHRPALLRQVDSKFVVPIHGLGVSGFTCCYWPCLWDTYSR